MDYPYQCLESNCISFCLIPIIVLYTKEMNSSYSSVRCPSTCVAHTPSGRWSSAGGLHRARTPPAGGVSFTHLRSHFHYMSQRYYKQILTQPLKTQFYTKLYPGNVTFLNYSYHNQLIKHDSTSTESKDLDVITDGC